MPSKPHGDVSPRTIATKPRLDWVDFAKAVAILLVVIYHVGGDGMDYLVTGSADTTGSTLWTTFNTVFLPIRMPLFFVCAGLLAQRALARPWRSVWHPKIAVLAWPYLLWSLAFAAIGMFAYAAGDLDYALDQLAGLPVGVSPYWFLAALLVFFTAAKLLARWSTVVLVVTAAAAVLTPVFAQQIIDAGPEPLVHTLVRLGRYAFWYFLGCYAADLVHRVADIRPVPLALGGGAAFVGLAGVAEVTDRVPELSFVLSVAGLAGAIGVSVWAVRSQRVRGWSQYLAARTLPIYLVHPILIGLTVLVATRGFDLRLDPVLALVATPVLVIAFTAAACWLNDRAKDTRAAWVFTAPAALDVRKD